MSRIMRWRGLRRTGVLALLGLWLVPVEWPGVPSVSGPGRAFARYGPPQDPGVPGQDPGGVDPFGQVPGDDSDMPRPQRRKAGRKKARLPEKGASKKVDPKARGDSAAGKKGADAGGLKFSQDIAPILVANCGNCHSGDRPGARKGKLELTSFEKLLNGTPDHKVIVPGKPEESHLVLRINGEEDPKMPQGGNNALSADAIAKITRWVKEGAKLDAGIDPKAAMASYAAKPSQLRKTQLARMSPQERDKQVIEAGRARWKQSGAKQKAEVVPGRHFILFSNLPGDRASSTVRAMEGPYNHLNRLLGPSVMDWPEKVSLYVFSNHNEFVEFVRSVEGRDVDSQEPKFSVRFDVPQPYIAAPDPAGGKKEEPRRRGRGKKAGDSEDAGAERSLLGLLTEGLGEGSVAAAGHAPRWLRAGLAAYLAAAAEPRSPYYRHLRRTALEDVRQGWQTRGTQGLGDQLPPEELRAVGFALVECLMRNEYFSQGFPTFLRGMLERGQGGLDDMLKGVYNGTREEFLNATETWIANAYGQSQ